MSTTTFSLDGCVIVYGGVRMTGFGESDAISVKRLEPLWNNVKCCDGGVVRNRQLCRHGEIRLTLRYDSTTHKSLEKQAEAASSSAMTISWPNGRVVESGDVVVQEYPELKVGERATDEVWVFHANPVDITFEEGGGR